MPLFVNTCLPALQNVAFLSITVFASSWDCLVIKPEIHFCMQIILMKKRKPLLGANTAIHVNKMTKQILLFALASRYLHNQPTFNLSPTDIWNLFADGNCLENCGILVWPNPVCFFLFCRKITYATSRLCCVKLQINSHETEKQMVWGLRVLVFKSSLWIIFLFTLVI